MPVAKMPLGRPGESVRPMQLLEHLRRSRPDMSPAEGRVADVVLRQPERVAALQLTQLAAAAGVSEPTVIRFCRTLGYSGYRAFVLDMAANMGAGQVTYDRDGIAPGDSLEKIRDKIFHGAQRVLQEVHQEVELTRMQQAIDLLTQAQRVELFAFGGSVPTAMDAQHKLFRLQVPTTVYSDPHIQHMAAHSLKQGDLVMAFSNTGTTAALVQVIELVRGEGLPVIALTPPSTPLAELATVALCVDADERGLLSLPLSVRLAWLALVDVLVMGLAQSRGAEAQKHLTRIIESQKPLRLAPAKRGRRPGPGSDLG